MHPLLRELERDNDPHDVLEIAPDVVLAARADREFATLAPGVTGRPADLQTRIGSDKYADAAAALDAAFRAADADPVKARGERSSTAKWARRALIGIVL